MPRSWASGRAVDAMPADCGRDPSKLAELSRRSGVQIVAATGLHHEKFYGPSHWSLRATEDELADLFVADVELTASTRATIRARSCARTPIRAGIVKIAGSQGGPSDRDLPIFRARPRRPTTGPASRSTPIARPGPGRWSRSAS